MKMSRVALLSVLFAAPIVTASEAPAAPANLLSHVSELVTAPFVFAKDYTLVATDLVVNYVVNPFLLNQLLKISYLQNGNFQTYVQNNYIGRAMVLAAATYLAMQAYNAQNSSDDEVIFDEYADVN